MPQAEALEEEFSEWTGAKYCLAVNSGTAALHCAVAGLDVEAGDEVIVPAMTYFATTAMVSYQHAVPVFVDIEPASYNLDPARIEEAIGPKTKAIVFIDYGGNPADIEGLEATAQGQVKQIHW